jgi:phage-related protein (TIGR01555 family)
MSILDSAVNQLFKRADSVMNVMTGLGGSADKGSQVAVDTGRTPLTETEKDALGRYDGYTVKWFERLANESTLTGWDVKAGLDTVEDFKSVEDYVADTIRRGFKTALKDGAALVLIVTDDGRANHLPLNLDRVTEVKALHVFDTQEFQVEEYETDYRNPNWRKPKLWEINPAVSGIVASKAGDANNRLRKVHHSRCLYIPGRELGERLRHLNGGKDDSYLDSTWDPLKDMRQTDQGLAVLAQEMKQDVIKIGGLEGVDASTLSDVFRERLRALTAAKGLLNVIMLAEDDEYQSRAAVTTGAKDLKGAAKSTWAAVTGMPEVVAFGATPGGLNTDGEAGRRAWEREVSQIQQTHLKPILRKIYEVYAAALGFGDTWTLEFRPLGTLTEKEKSEVREVNARTDRIYRQEGILSPEHIRSSRFGEDGYGDIRPMPDGAPVPGDPSRSLDGTQIQAIMEIMLQAAGERLPPENATEVIIASTNLPRAQVEALMAGLGTTFTVDPLLVDPVETAEAGESALLGKNAE